MGIVGSLVASVFGGWSTGLTFLLVFMAIDYFSGLVVAGVFKNSPKTDTGALESRAGLKGLCRKGMMLAIVIVGYGLDVIIGANYVHDAVIIGLCVNETISIVENAGLMGLPIPNAIKNAIDVLVKKSKGE